MNQIDTHQIKEITNQLIGYENFKMEEEMKTKKTYQMEIKILENLLYQKLQEQDLMLLKHILI